MKIQVIPQRNRLINLYHRLRAKHKNCYIMVGYSCSKGVEMSFPEHESIIFNFLKNKKKRDNLMAKYLFVTQIIKDFRLFKCYEKMWGDNLNGYCNHFL